jgi:ubiquinone/menaquinone biosynthesis C-methylase UbiE
MADAEFDRLARTYDQVHRNNIGLSGEEPAYFAAYKMRDFARELQRLGAPEDGCFLDFGSGIGASIEPFMQHMGLASLRCADVSAESLALSQERHAPTYGSRLGYITIDGGHLPLADASMDGAFACCVFHHIPPDEHQHALTELRRVVRPGAPLMIYEHNPLNPLTRHAVNTCPLDEHAILVRAGEMARRMRQAGWSVGRADYRVFFPASMRALRSMEDALRWLPLGAQYAIHARA